MRKAILVLLLPLAAMPLVCGDSLYGQAIAKLLDRLFPEPEVSYLLLTTETGELLASRWENIKQPLPLGSLVKPFTALAYARSHGFRYPTYTCRGEADGCWYAAGHGRLSMTQAIAHSCNVYFRLLSQEVAVEQMRAVALRYNLPGLPAQASPSVLVGLGTEWRIDALAMARAYGRLAFDGAEPGVGQLLSGMRLSAREGTGREVGRALDGFAVRVKTGTAPCVHGVEWSGDGYVLMLYPADSPRFTLLVRVHGKPGAEAAITGGRMLRSVVEAK